MIRRNKQTFLIVVTLVLLMVVFALPSSAYARGLLVITPTPTSTTSPDTPTPTNTPTEPPVEPPTDTPTPTPTVTGTRSPDTPTPTNPPVQPPEKTPEKTEVVLLPQTGEYPIDPQLGIQLFLAFIFLAVIGIVLFRAVRGSRTQE